MSLSVGDKPAPMPFVDDEFVSRVPRVDALKKGRFLDTLRRIYEVVGAVDCYNCPNTFIVNSKRYGNQLLKAIKRDSSQHDMYTMQTEVSMLLMAEAVHPSIREHILSITERGTTKDFSYVIMNRPGPSLEYIYRNLCAGNFSPWTLHHIAVQTLMALRELHHLGFVLRDVSLQSFCIGYGPLGEEHVFINQLLAIRPYIDSDGAMLRSSSKSIARPFSPYCSSRARLRDDNCFPQQDAEAWLWMMMCLHDASWLPLDAEKERADKEQRALEIKEALWNGDVAFPILPEAQMPSCYRHILDYLRKLTMPDRVGYEHIRSLLEKFTPIGHLTYPLDWQLADKRKLLTEDEFMDRCPRNKAADDDRTLTIRRDVRMDQHAFFTSRVVTTLKRDDASIESRSRTTVTRNTEDGEAKNSKVSGPVAMIPEGV